MLARMVGARPCRIIAVIGGEDDEITGLEFGFKLGQAAVKRFEAGGVACDIAAMAELGVKIDEIGEQKAAIGEAINLG